MGYVSMADPNRIIPLNRKNLPVEHTEWPISFQFCSIYILMSLKLIVVDACFFFCSILFAKHMVIYTTYKTGYLRY